MFFEKNFLFIVDVAVVSLFVMTASGTLLVKHRSPTYNNIKSTSHQLLKRHRRQTNLLTRKYLTKRKGKKKKKRKSSVLSPSWVINKIEVLETFKKTMAKVHYI